MSDSTRDEDPRVTHPVRLLVLGVGILAVAGLLNPLAGRPAAQPIAFNHSLHVGEVGLDCTDCHRYVLTGARATIPNVEDCGECHMEAQGESAEERRLIAFVESGEPIPWRKVYRVPDHVYFSHRRHAAIAGIECERCHGPMAERTLPVTRPAVRLTMEACIECHDQAGVSNDCIACHR